MRQLLITSSRGLMRQPWETDMTREEQRLEQSRERNAYWKRWGPYLSERAWGTVREDYSPDGMAWNYLSFDQARSKAYRWGEDGLAGISDRRQYICFAVSLWNGRDPILKERIFGLSGTEGNHGEDVKEYYFYLDSTPTHSYMKYLYKYPQAEFPYAKLVEENRRRRKSEPEYELMDTGVFDENRYFDVLVEYAKATPEDILVRIGVTNRGPEPAELHLLPTLWFRNTWAWAQKGERPRMRRSQDVKNTSVVQLCHQSYGHRWLFCEGVPELLFTENETNTRRLYGHDSGSEFAKDGINDYLVGGNRNAINPSCSGTKAAAHYLMTLAPGETRVVKLRLTDQGIPPTGGDPCDHSFDKIFADREREADEFYATVIPQDLSDDARNVMRQSLGGLLWSKQFYYYDVRSWLEGDAVGPKPPEARQTGRNSEWAHLYNDDIISMPDKWEYPWFAAWDLAFHAVPLALVDADFAKEQLILLLREWYMHPNGQLPAYEWEFGDVNPPVHAWAAWRVYKIDKKQTGKGDTQFLERIFQKLLLNFTWWINRKDSEGRNVFQGGFLGLDNIGVFDRSKPLPTGGHLEQADGTSWMGMYCLNMLAIALELASDNSAYEDMASKFWEHFLYIANAMNNLGDENERLWNEADGFYYDVLCLPDGQSLPMKVRSMVGLIPLFAIESLEPEILKALPAFKRRLEWFVDNRKDLVRHVASMRRTGEEERRKLSIVDREQLRRVLRVMLDENEFLSAYGIRSISRRHLEQPYVLRVDGIEHSVKYEPAESSTGMFGGNANWRGPVWFPVNFLLIESLQKFHHFFGEDYKVECPTGSGQMMTLWEVAAEISRRLTRIFLRDETDKRPVYGDIEKLQTDPHWRDLILFYEYFNGDSGAGLGASHQTGWTGLVAKLIQQSGE
jgi:hypothetical protein